MKNAVKQLKAFQFTRTFMRHWLNMTLCVKQTSKMFDVSQYYKKLPI